MDNLLQFGLRFYFYILIVLSLRLGTMFGIFLALCGFLIIEYYCEELNAIEKQ